MKGTIRLKRPGDKAVGKGTIKAKKKPTLKRPDSKRKRYA